MKIGFSLVEVIVASAVLGLLSTSIVGVFITTGKLQKETALQNNSVHELRNSMDRVRTIRDRDFNNLVDGNFYLFKNETTWELVKPSTKESAISINIETLDDRVKLVTATDPQNKLSLETIFADWQELLPVNELSINAMNTSVTGKGNRLVEGLLISNIGINSIEITSLQLSWSKDNKNRKLQSVILNDEEQWFSSVGERSGDEIDLLVAVPGNSQVVMDFNFSSSMKNQVFDLVLRTSTGGEVISQFKP